MKFGHRQVMKNSIKNTELFSKTIHEVKFAITTIKKEKDKYHKKLNNVIKLHDKEMNKSIKELLQVVNDLYELYSDLA